MIIVTGAAGFIGYNIAKRLNLMGIKDLILLDNKKKYPDPKKFLNLEYSEYRNYTDLNNLNSVKLINTILNTFLHLIHEKQNLPK